MFTIHSSLDWYAFDCPCGPLATLPLDIQFRPLTQLEARQAEYRGILGSCSLHRREYPPSLTRVPNIPDYIWGGYLPRRLRRCRFRNTRWQWDQDDTLALSQNRIRICSDLFKTLWALCCSDQCRCGVSFVIRTKTIRQSHVVAKVCCNEVFSQILS